MTTQLTPERVMEIAREYDLIAAMDAVPIPTKDILAFATRIAAEARRESDERMQSVTDVVHGWETEGRAMVSLDDLLILIKPILALEEKP